MSNIIDEKTGTENVVEALDNSNCASTDGTPPALDVEKNASSGGTYFVKDNTHGFKTAKDGVTVLIPQPSDDPLDPLNWSWGRKHKVLIALLLPSLLTDWGMTWGTTLFEAQAATWEMSVPAVAASVSGGIFLQGPGGVMAVPLVQRYGRYLLVTIKPYEYS